MYINGEEGFRCRRDKSGNPIKASFDVSYTSPDAVLNSNARDATSAGSGQIRAGDGTVIKIEK